MPNYSMNGLIGNGRTKIMDLNTEALGSINVQGISFSCGSYAPTWEIYIDKDINDLNMSLPSRTAYTTGGTIPRNTAVHVRVAAVDANGRESGLSDGLQEIVTGAGTDTNRVNWTWAAVSGAVSYNVYVSDRPGMECFYANVVGLACNVTEIPVVDPWAPPGSLGALPVGIPSFYFRQAANIVNDLTFANLIYSALNFKVYCTVSSGTGSGSPAFTVNTAG